MKEYDQIHDWYLRERRNDVGVPELEALMERLPRGAQVLDLGCGTGLPLACVIAQHGAHVFGIDSSPAMIATFRGHLPSARAECCRMEDAELGEGVFDAAVAWGSLFHLAAAAQETVIAKVGKALRPSGLFLFTAALEPGTVQGPMNGVEFPYVSLGKERYREVLDQAGMTPERDFRDRFDNYVYIAIKR